MSQFLPPNRRCVTYLYCSSIYSTPHAKPELPVDLYISASIREKLANKHGGITDDEIKQCFLNMPDGYEFIRDDREEHQTDPPTWMFISETNRKRKLKICFMVRAFETPDGPRNRIVIK